MPNRHTTYRLTFEDAVNVWLRYWNGEFQHIIAASYAVNSGRVNDVLKERMHYGSYRYLSGPRHVNRLPGAPLMAFSALS